MRKSLFVRYFAICAAVVIIAFTLLGVIMMLVAAQYFKSEKYDLLKNNAVSAAVLTAGNCRYDPLAKTVELDVPAIQRSYTILARAIDARLLLVDGTGKVNLENAGQFENEKFSVETVFNSAPDITVSEKILKRVDEGEYFEVGTLGGLYSSQQYIYGLPVKVDDGTAIGYLFVSTPATAMMEFLMQVLQMFCLSAVAVILLSFSVFYVITLQMVKPLRRMAYAAKRFGSGDFSERLEVQGEDEIAALALELNNMAQSLSVLESSRRSFVANVSHELRTPMTTISGFVDGVLDGTIPKEKEKEYLTIVSDEIKRLSRLVRMMLNMSRLESGEVKPNLVDFDLLDVILQTLFSFEHPIEEKNVNIEGLDHEKVIVEADQDLIHQVVYNLVENAVKFVNEGGRISFSFRAEQGRTYVAIRNSGEGLSKEEIQRVFERFYKSDKSRGLDKTGVGLGLNIVRSIVAMHGGEITVRSEEGSYCEFEFDLPSGRLSRTHKKLGSGLPRVES